MSLPLTIGSTETMRLSITKDGLVWDLTGGTVVLRFVSPTGGTSSVNASSAYNGGADAAWTVASPAGTWTRAWDCTDAHGVRQVTQAVSFSVVASP